MELNLIRREIVSAKVTEKSNNYPNTFAKNSYYRVTPYERGYLLELVTDHYEWNQEKQEEGKLFARSAKFLPLDSKAIANLGLTRENFEEKMKEMMGMDAVEIGALPAFDAYLPHPELEFKNGKFHKGGYGMVCKPFYASYSCLELQDTGWKYFDCFGDEIIDASYKALLGDFDEIIVTTQKQADLLENIKHGTSFNNEYAWHCWRANGIIDGNVKAIRAKLGEPVDQMTNVRVNNDANLIATSTEEFFDDNSDMNM